MKDLEVRAYASDHRGHTIEINPDWKNAETLDEVYTEYPGIEVRTTKSNMNIHDYPTTHEVKKIEVVVSKRFATIRLVTEDDSFTFTCELTEEKNGEG